MEGKSNHYKKVQNKLLDQCFDKCNQGIMCRHCFGSQVHHRWIKKYARKLYRGKVKAESRRVAQDGI